MTQEIRYTDGSRLYEYEVDSVVFDVPANYFSVHKDETNFRNYKIGKKWTDKTDEIIINFDPLKLGNLFYCKKCRIIEDGRHRLEIMEKLGISKFNIHVGGDCYAEYVKAGRFMRTDPTFLLTLTDLLTKHPTGNVMDAKWLYANAAKKWPYISRYVDFRGKTYLDIGCHVGLSVLTAYSRMASQAVGIDIRKDVIKIANAAIPKRTDFILFKKEGIANFFPEIKYDIVSCMGLLHYFDVSEYERILKHICDLCTETLILEFRLRSANEKNKLTRSGIQTLPTYSWMSEKLRKFGFNEMNKFSIDDNKRGLWIVRR